MRCSYPYHPLFLHPSACARPPHPAVMEVQELLPMDFPIVPTQIFRRHPAAFLGNSNQSAEPCKTAVPYASLIQLSGDIGYILIPSLGNVNAYSTYHIYYAVISYPDCICALCRDPPDPDDPARQDLSKTRAGCRTSGSLCAHHAGYILFYMTNWSRYRLDRRRESRIRSRLLSNALSSTSMHAKPS